MSEQGSFPSTPPPLATGPAGNEGELAPGGRARLPGRALLGRLRSLLERLGSLGSAITIRTRLLAAFVILVLLSGVVIIAGTTVGSLRAGQTQVQNQLASVVTLKEAEIRTWVSQLQTSLGLLLHEHEIVLVIGVVFQGNPNSAAYRDLQADLRTDLQKVVQEARLFEEVFLLNEQGMVALSTDLDQEGKIYENDAFFQRGQEGPYVDPPAFAPSLGRATVVFSIPVKDSQGQAQGVLAGRASMSTLAEIMRETAGLGDTGETYLVGSYSALLTAVRGDEQPAYVRSVAANNAVRAHINGAGLYNNYREVRVVGAYRWIPDLQIALLAEQEVTEAFRGIYQTLLQGGIIAGAAVLVAIGVALLITRSIANPLARLSRTAAEIALGNLNQAAMVDRGDEIGALAKAFNRMTGRLRETIAGLERRNRSLQSAVERYVNLMGEIARGDLSARVVVEEAEAGARDPLVVLGHSLNDMAASLQRMTVQVRDAATNLSSASSEILATTTQQSAGAAEQSAAITQASATIDEVHTIAEQTAQRAEGVADLAQRTADVSRSGHQAVSETIAGLQQVRQKVETIAQNILSLSEQAQAIGQIIAAVSEIAAQSNMLALNAAVEAARAGEAGKGFAVVAGEVRALAEQSRTATVQIKEILSQIQCGVNTAVMATEEGMKGADAGVRLGDEAGLAIRALADSVTESAQAAVQISTAAGQQQAGMEQIAVAMQNIHQVTVQSVAGARQSEQAAEELSGVAQQLRQVVEQYRL